MKVLGLRLNNEKPRYALVRTDGSSFELLNANTESRLVMPAGMEQADAKSEWLYRELARIFNDHPDISKVCIKTSEYGLTEKKAMRETSYLEGVALLFCRQKGLAVTVKSYKSLSTTSKQVRQHAETRVGRTSKYWDAKIADAIIVAWDGAKS